MLSIMEKKKSFIINSIYLAVWMLIIYFLITFASAYLLPFLIGIIIAHLVQKPAVFMNKKIGIKKNKCAAILSVIIYLFVSIIIFLFFWFIFSQFNRFVKFLSNNSEQLKIYFDNIFLKIESLLNKFNVDNVKTLYNDAINSLMVNVTSYFSNAITSLVKNTPTVLLSCVVTIVSTCYIAKDYDKILQFVKGFVSEKFLKVVTEIKDISKEYFLKFSLGYFWLFLITFGELLLGFLILGINKFIILALIVAFLDLLPVIGTGTILIPWTIIEFIKNNYFFAVGLLILYLIITITRNSIEPKIIGKQIDMNPLFTLIFIFIGFRLAGIIGMIFLPIILTVLFTFLRRRVTTSNEHK